MKNRSVLARHRLRCALVCLSTVLALFCTPIEVSACKSPGYAGGIIDVHGNQIAPCEHRSLSYVGDGLFQSFERDSNSKVLKLRVKYYNKDGKQLNIEVPKDWQANRVFVPHPGAPSELSITELPANSLLGLSFNGINRIVDTKGRELIPASKNWYSCFPYDDYLVFSERELPEHLGADHPAYFAFNPSTGKKYYGKDVERFVYKNAVPFERIDKQAISRQVLKVNHLADKYSRADICLPFRQQSSLFESSAVDGWNNDHAVVYCDVAGSQTGKYGVINRNFEFVLQPQFSTLKHLYGNVYFSRRAESDASVAIDTTGRQLSLLPPNTHNAFSSEDLIVCEQQAGDPGSLTSVSLVSREGAVLHTVPNSRVQAFKCGIVVLETNNWQCLWHDNVLSILTRDGIMASGIEASKAEPISRDRLLLSKLDLKLSIMDWYYASCGVRRELQFSYILRDLDLIGQSLQKVEELFGKPDAFGNTFELEKSRSSPDFNGFELKFEDNKVSAWRWINRRGAQDLLGPWITSNVQVDWIPFSGYDRDDLVDWRTVKIEPKVVATRH